MVMQNDDYPYGIDCVWLATDQAGRVAAFITAGEAPIASHVLENIPDIRHLEYVVLDAFPVCTTADVRVKVPNPASYVALAERGIFVYDWTDLHKVKAEKSGKYELVAVPIEPIFEGDVSSELRKTTCLHFIGVEAFGEPFVDISSDFRSVNAIG